MRVREALPLPYGAEIVAEFGSWHVRFTFPGPDWRYKPDTLTVWPNGIPQLIRSIKDAFANYQALGMLVGGSATEVEDGVGHATTRLGGPFDGVCIGGYRVLCRTAEDVERVSAVLARAETRGRELVRGIGLAGLQENGSPSGPAACRPLLPSRPAMSKSIGRRRGAAAGIGWPRKR